MKEKDAQTNIFIKRSNRKMKKVIAIILAVVIAGSFFVFAAYATQEDNLQKEDLVLGVYPFSDDSTLIKWWFNDVDSRYYLFLPSDAKKDSVRLSINKNSVTVGATVIENNALTDVFSEGNEFTVLCDEKEYPLVVMQSENLPSVYITTESGSLDYVHADKSNKEKAVISVAENGEVTMSNISLKQIKGRGNSTWNFEKKPYNISFDDKVDLFGMGKAKKWSLLASYHDGAFLRNPLAFYLAEEMGLHYTSEYRHIDLYINGDYLGNYILCESVEIGKTRIDINDLKDANEDANPDVDDIEDLPAGSNVSPEVLKPYTVPNSMKWIEIPNDPEDISGGYLLELDFQTRYAEEISGFVSNRGQCVVVKEPEYASKAQVEYVSRLWNEAEEAFYSEDGYNSLGKHYSDYFDVESLARMFILEEFAGENDAGRSSVFFYKSQDSDKFITSPVWDFDGAFGRDIPVADISTNMPDIWFAANRYMTPVLNGKNVTIPTIFNLAFRHEDFRAVVANVWKENDKLFSTEKTGEFIETNSDLLRASALMDIIRWKDRSFSNIKNVDSIYTKWVNEVSNYVSERKEWLDKGFSDESALLYYDINTGGGFTANFPILTKGQTANVSQLVRGADINITAPSKDFVFIGWNTKADGTGIMYRPDEEIVLNEPLTVLYAQWKNISECTYGDVDGDGKITASDARLALRASVGLEYFADETATAEFMLADVNRDGKVTAADARLILRKSVGVVDAEFIVE